MKALPITALLPRKPLILAALLSFSWSSFADTLNPLVDDFSDTASNSLGVERLFMNDTVTGGSTTIEQQVLQGVLSVKGEIVPPRGQLGWASSVLPLEQQGKPMDASAYKGIQLLLKISEGNISVSANSADVTNFDYHSALVTVAADGKFHQVKIPFASMKRAWSEQVPLNTTNLSALSIVAFDMQKGHFDFEVDEVRFY